MRVVRDRLLPGRHPVCPSISNARALSRRRRRRRSPLASSLTFAHSSRPFAAPRAAQAPAHGVPRDGTPTRGASPRDHRGGRDPHRRGGGAARRRRGRARLRRRAPDVHLARLRPRPERRRGRRPRRYLPAQLRASALARPTHPRRARDAPRGCAPDPPRGARGSDRETPGGDVSHHRHRGREPRQVLARPPPRALRRHAGVEPDGGKGGVRRQDGERARRRAHLTQALQVFPKPGHGQGGGAPELEAIVKALLEPLLGMLNILATGTLAAAAAENGDPGAVSSLAANPVADQPGNDALLHTLLKCFHHTVAAYMPNALVPSLPRWLEVLVKLLEHAPSWRMTERRSAEPRARAAKRAVQTLISLVTRHRRHVDRALPQVCAHAAAFAGAIATRRLESTESLPSTASRLCALCFDLLARVSETAAGFETPRARFRAFARDGGVPGAVRVAGGRDGLGRGRGGVPAEEPPDGRRRSHGVQRGALRAEAERGEPPRFTRRTRKFRRRAGRRQERQERQGQTQERRCEIQIRRETTVVFARGRDASFPRTIRRPDALRGYSRVVFVLRRVGGVRRARRVVGR